MSPERLLRVSRLFDELARREPSEREELLLVQCSDDPWVRAEVARLLGHDLEAAREGFLEVPRLPDLHLLGDQGGAYSFPGTTWPVFSGGSEGESCGAPPSATVDRDGRVEIRAEIASGGMGTVLRGHDSGLGRTVAVKVLLERHRGNSDLAQRFVDEAKIAGQLQHPGIVPVYYLGMLTDDRPYFAMKLVKGRTLATLLSNRAHPSENLSQLLGIFEQISQALAYTHSRGVIHRDLKPSNVMIGRFGEVQVMDWGLAKVLDRGGKAASPPPGDTIAEDSITTPPRRPSDTDLSRSGSILGTPSYMAPEQARGEGELVDERADVFALGSILCEILTGKPAFIGESSGSIQRKAARGDLLDAMRRLHGCGADTDLLALARHCLASEREDRPRDATAVASAITNYLASVQDRLRRSEMERVEARGRLRLGAAVAVTVLIGGLLFAGMWALYERRRAEQARQFAQVFEEKFARSAALATEARQAGPESLERWKNALGEAGAAQALLQVQGGVATADQRGRLARLLVEAAAGEREARESAARARKDRVFPDRLATIRDGFDAHHDFARTDSDYAAAFREYGIDISALSPADAAAQIASRPIATEIALALDNWATLGMKRSKGREDWKRLLHIARAADPDPWRNRLRETLDKPDQLQQLRSLAQTETSTSPPVSLAILARLLAEAGDKRRGVEILREARLRGPADFWINVELAALDYLEASRKGLNEAVRCASVAVAQRPTSFHARTLLIYALHALGERGEETDEIAAAYQQLRGTAVDHYFIAEAIKRLGFTEQALAEYRKADSLDALNNNHVGSAGLAIGEILEGQSRWADAVQHYQGLVRRQPGEPVFQGLLGRALVKAGDPGAAIVSLYKAVQLGPGSKAYRSDLIELVQALRRNGQAEEAIAPALELIRLEPEDRKARLSYIGCLVATKRWPEAATAAEQLAAEQFIDVDPGIHEDWLYAAALWARSSERSGYDRVRRRILDRFGKTQDPRIAERTAKLCLLMPGEQAEIKDLAPLAQLAVQAWEGNSLHPYALLAAGLAQYRLGRLDQARRIISEAIETGRNPNLLIPANCVLCMIQIDSDKDQDARQAYQLAYSLRAKMIDTTEFPEQSRDRHDPLLMDSLLNEAWSKLQDRCFPPDPFAR
jgi:tetratricopeptide (TPR) repeat protein